MNSARKHTDGTDRIGDQSTVRLVVTEGGRAVPYDQPANPNPATLDDLDKILEPFRAHGHVCRSCGVMIDGPCGSYCKRCSEEIAALHAQASSAFWSVAWALLPWLLAVALGVVAIKGAM